MCVRTYMYMYMYVYNVLVRVFNVFLWHFIVCAVRVCCVCMYVFYLLYIFVIYFRWHVFNNLCIAEKMQANNVKPYDVLIV